MTLDSRAPMADLLDSVEIETGSAPAAAVIWMHGLGADGHDFEPIVPELEMADGLAIRFVFPHAPVRPVTVNAGMVMRAWYDVDIRDGRRREDEAGVRASQRQIEALIARENRRGISSSRIALAGFSQGGAMALQTGLRYPERLAGIAALSCFLPLPDKLAGEVSAANRDIPIFMAHGTRDPMIPLARGQESREAIEALGYCIEWHAYAMPHAVCAEEIADLSAWLGRVIAAPR